MADARILIVDDHPLFREALRHALSTAKSHLEISEADSLNTLTAQLARDDSCDLVLLDLRMPGVQGLSGLIYLRSQCPNIPVVIVSANEEAGIVQKSLDLGLPGSFQNRRGRQSSLRRSILCLTVVYGLHLGPTGRCPVIPKLPTSRGVSHHLRHSRSAS